MNNSLNLNGKTIILTGASGYFGQALTISFINFGAKVIAISRSQSDTLDSIALKQSKNLDIYNCDLEDVESRRNLCEELLTSYKKVDGLINNAYSGTVGDIDSIEEIDFLNATKLNLSAPFDLVKRLLPLLVRNINRGEDFSSVVNVASVYGKLSPLKNLYTEKTSINPIHYGSAKAGLIQMTKYLSCNLASQGVRVNSISPGAFPNPASVEDEEFINNLKSRIPMRRVGLPEEITFPIAFLISPQSSYITGADLAVDGGWTAL